MSLGCLLMIMSLMKEMIVVITEMKIITKKIIKWI